MNGDVYAITAGAIDRRLLAVMGGVGRAEQRFVPAAGSSFAAGYVHPFNMCVPERITGTALFAGESTMALVRRSLASVGGASHVRNKAKGTNRKDEGCANDDDGEGLSFWQKISIGAICSFISTKVIWAWLIGRRVKRSRGGKPPDGIDTFVDWWAKVAAYVPRKVWNASKRVLPEAITQPVDRLALRIKKMLYGADTIEAAAQRAASSQPAEASEIGYFEQFVETIESGLQATKDGFIFFTEMLKEYWEAFDDTKACKRMERAQRFQSRERLDKAAREHERMLEKLGTNDSELFCAHLHRLAAAELLYNAAMMTTNRKAQKPLQRALNYIEEAIVGMESFSPAVRGFAVGLQGKVAQALTDDDTSSSTGSGTHTMPPYVHHMGGSHGVMQRATVSVRRGLGFIARTVGFRPTL